MAEKMFLLTIYQMNVNNKKIMMKKLQIIILMSVLSINYSYSEFTSYNIGTTATLNSIYFINSLTGYCTADNSGIYRSTNGGINWSLNTVGSSVNWKSINFINSNSGMAAGNNQVAIYSGTVWTVTALSAIYDLRKIQMISSSAVYALCKNLATNDYLCLKSTNSGINWSAYDIPGTDYKDIFFLNSNTGFASGQNATITRTTNGGINWNELTDFSNYMGDNALNSIRINPSTGLGFALGVDPFYAYKTTNHGANWSLISFTYPQINGLTVSGNKIFACGDQNLIIRSSNAGVNWTRHTSPQSNSINSIFSVDTNLVFACGNNGTVYKTTNGGGSPVGINLQTTNADEYELHQNYPNPFNPNTIISFNLPESGNVKLTVFTICGKTIYEIIDKYLNAGNYNFEFKAGNISSGVYFYRLQSGSYSITKKMILIK